MRRVHVDEWSSVLGDGMFRQLRLNSPATGRWFPALREISWCITKYNSPYADLFFSPDLENVSIHILPSWIYAENPRDIIPTVIPIISAVPGPTLQSLVISVDRDPGVPWGCSRESLSSVVLCCGPSLTEFTSPIPLSDAAVDHLIHLPHLHIWRVENPPPSYYASSLPLVFPPLTDLSLGKGACEWLSLFRRLEDLASPTRGVTSLFRLKESLEALSIQSLPGPITDFSLASPIQMFRNLGRLDVDVSCHDEDGEGQCIFKLNDDNVTKLAMALPQLGYLILGHPCFENTCATTVACLLSISVYCVKLDTLEIHFNTENIVDDLKNISEDPKFRELRSLPKCPLSFLDVSPTPLDIDEYGYKTVADGMIDIFPSLKICKGVGDDDWNEVTKHLYLPHEEAQTGRR